MHYIESGSGPPLVLLHAFPVDARMWSGVRGRLEPQARVITPDQRGLGQSPLPSESGAGTGEPNLEPVADDVVALLDKLELPQVVLGGCSMGGYVAMEVLRRAPSRVAGLLLADTKAAADDAEQRDNRLGAADRAEREGTGTWLAENSLPGLLSETSHQERPELVADVRDMIETQPASGVAWAQRAMAARPDSTETLRSYPGPALVVVGEQDTLSPPSVARDMVAALPEGELRILPHTGHLAAMEDAKVFVDAVRPWLNQFRSTM